MTPAPSPMQIPALPRGRIHPAMRSFTAQARTAANANTEVAMTDFADIPVTIDATRLYLVTFSCAYFTGVSGDLVRWNLRDGGGSAPSSGSSLVNWLGRAVPNTTSTVTHTFTFDIEPGDLSTGLHHLGVFFLRASGSGTLQMGDTAIVSTFNVIDLGQAA